MSYGIADDCEDGWTWNDEQDSRRGGKGKPKLDGHRRCSLRRLTCKLSRGHAEGVTVDCSVGLEPRSFERDVSKCRFVPQNLQQ